MANNVLKGKSHSEIKDTLQKMSFKELEYTPWRVIVLSYLPFFKKVGFLFYLFFKVNKKFIKQIGKIKYWLIFPFIFMVMLIFSFKLNTYQVFLVKKDKN